MKILFGAIGSQVTILDVAVRIVMAILIGSIIGFERERKNRPAGLRTHVLVCLTATLVAMAERQMIYEISTLQSSAVNVSFGRLSVGVITGIGFIGAGTIMMSRSKIIGLTTAASLWCIACLGLINGMGFSLVSLVASILVIFVLQVLRIGEKTSLSRVIEVKYVYNANSKEIIEKQFDELNLKVRDYSVSFQKVESKKICYTRYAIVFKDREEVRNAMSKLADLDDVIEVRTENAI